MDPPLFRTTRPGALPWGEIQQVTTDLNNLDVLKAIPAGRQKTLVIRSPVPEYWHTGTSLGLHFLVLESGIWSAGLSSFLDCVSIPTLRDLRLVCPDANEAASKVAKHRQANSQSVVTWRNASDASVRMVVRSGCALRSFDFSLGGLYYGDLNDPSLAHGLVEMVRVCHSGLETLRIVKGCGPALLENALFTLSFENLRSLELVWVHRRKPPKSLINMLDSIIARSMLSSVVFGVRGPVHAGVGVEMSECMRRLREGGIKSRLW